MQIWRFSEPWGKKTVETYFNKAPDSDDDAARALSMIGEAFLVFN